PALGAFGPVQRPDPDRHGQEQQWQQEKRRHRQPGQRPGGQQQQEAAPALAQHGGFGQPGHARKRIESGSMKARWSQPGWPSRHRFGGGLGRGPALGVRASGVPPIRRFAPASPLGGRRTGMLRPLFPLPIGERGIGRRSRRVRGMRGSMTQPVTLAIDTAAPRLQLAVVLPDGRTDILVEDIAKGHAEILFERLATLLARNDLAYENIERVAVTTGPGSFTGLRIGLSAARGLGLARKVPVLGIPSLLAISLAAPSGPVAVLLDARRGEAYFETFPGPGIL